MMELQLSERFSGFFRGHHFSLFAIFPYKYLFAFFQALERSHDFIHARKSYVPVLFFIKLRRVCQFSEFFFHILY